MLERLFREIGMTDSAAMVVAEQLILSEFLRQIGLPEPCTDLAVAVTSGMLSAQERNLLYSLTSRWYRGKGAIIDGGSFFGSSVVASAAGLRKNPKLSADSFTRFPDGKPIHGYELGFLPAPKNPKTDLSRVFGGAAYTLGESFVPILEGNVAPYKDFVSLHIGDLNKESWPDFPIEIAFIDVCKTISLNAHVSRQFYPAMIGGDSVLINQDFFFDRLPWIKVTMGYLKDYFRWEGQVFFSSVYTNLRAVPSDVANYDPFQEATCDECLAYHDAVTFPGLARKYQFYMDLSRAYLVALKGRKDDALDRLKSAAASYQDLMENDEADRGNRFRLDRATRQITNDMIFKVS